MKVFAVLLLSVCAVSAGLVQDSVVKVDRKGGSFAYSVDGLVPHSYVAPTPYVAPTQYVAQSPYGVPVVGHTPYVHPGVAPYVAPVVGKPVVYTATHPVGAYQVPYAGYYGYAGYPYGVPVVAKPEKVE